MALTEYEGLSAEDLLFRLSLVLELPWESFLETELWQIRNRAFVAGERVVLANMDLMDQLFHSGLILRSARPGQALQQYYEQMKELLQVQRPLSQQERMERIQAHNRRAAEELSRHG